MTANSYIFLLLAIAAQYSGAAIALLLSGQVILFQADGDFIADAGIGKYMKDTALLLYGIYWPVAYQSNTINARLTLYGAWFATLIVVGVSTAFIVGNGALVLSGLRWLLTVHAAVGLIACADARAATSSSQRRVVLVSLVLAVPNVLACFYQAYMVGDIASLGVGAYRLSGLFNGSGTLAYFGLGLAVVSVCAAKASSKSRAIMIGLGFFLTICSGWRHAQLLALCLIVAFPYIAADENGKVEFSPIRFAVLPLLALGAVILAGFLLDRTERGSLIGAQMGSDGRVDLFYSAMRDMISAGPMAVLFGGGLGAGTNTAVGLAGAYEDSPNEYFLNVLVDNTFATAMLQLGLVGSLVFWTGIGVVLLRLRPASRTLSRRWIVVCLVALGVCFAQNIFEHSVLLISLAFSLGMLFASQVPVSDRG